MKTLSFARVCGINALLAWTSTAHVSAAVSVDKIFTDNMVFQRGAAVPVSGDAEPGEEITVRFAGQEKSVRADGSGRWTGRLTPLPANAQPQILEIAGKTTQRKLQNVLVGDVWLFAGQSNMAFWLEKARDAQAEIASAEIPALRFCGIHFFLAAEPVKQIQGGWGNAIPPARRRCPPWRFSSGASCSA